MIRMIIIFFTLFFVNSTSFAGDLSYTCKVIHVYELANDGSLRISNLEKQFKDSEFSVSRVTGEIIGEVIPTLLANSTKVINKGNKEYSFKSIAHFDAVNKPLSLRFEDQRVLPAFSYWKYKSFVTETENLSFNGLWPRAILIFLISHSFNIKHPLK